MLTLPSESSGKGAEFGMLMLEDRFGCPLLIIEARLFAGFDMKLDLLSEALALTLDDRRTWPGWLIIEARFDAVPELTLVDRFSRSDDSAVDSSSGVE